MKKGISLLLVCLLLLVPAASAAGSAAYSYSVPTVCSNDAMVEVFEVTYKAGSKTYVDYVCVPTDYQSAAEIALEYPSNAVVVSQGEYLRYDLSLSNTGDALLSSGQCSFTYDDEKLTLAADYVLFNGDSDWVVNATEGTFYASVAYSHGVQHTNELVYSLYFTVTEAAQDGDWIPINFVEGRLGLVDTSEANIDPSSYTINCVDGSITIGSTIATIRTVNYVADGETIQTYAVVDGHTLAAIPAVPAGAAAYYAYWDVDLKNVAITKDYTVTAKYRLWGDVHFDNAVTITDISKLQRYIVGLEELDAIALAVSDVNEDGGISVADVSLIQKYILNLGTLPVPVG